MSWGNNRIRGNPQSVQKLLDENAQLIQAIVDYQTKGKSAECVQYQQLLHKNLMYLASFADSTHNIQAMIPPPPSSSQVTSIAPASAAMGEPSGNVHGNIMDSKGVPGTSMDQTSSGIPLMTSQGISSAGSQITSGIHTTAAAMTTVSGDGTTTALYGANVSMSSQSMDSNTPPVTGYPGNVNQMMTANMPISSQVVMQGQSKSYMPPNIHAARMQQQGQQFMMQQGIAMGYNRPSLQVHPSQQEPQQPPGNQAFMGNQAVASQPAPVGIVPYQQTAPSYHPYNPMQHVNAGYNNPYVPQ